MRDKMKKTQVHDNRLIDLHELRPVKNYSDLMKLLKQLESNEILLAENELLACAEANRLELMVNAKNRAQDAEEKEVLEHCASIYTAFANAKRDGNEKKLTDKIQDLLKECGQKNSPPAQNLQSPGSSNRSTPVSHVDQSKRSGGSSRHLSSSPDFNHSSPKRSSVKTANKVKRSESPFGSGSGLDSLLLTGSNSPVSSKPKRSTPDTNAQCLKKYHVKSEFLQLEFATCRNVEKLVLTDYQDANAETKSATDWLALIEEKYNELKSQCCPCGFFDRFRSNFFDGAFKFAQEKLNVTLTKEALTANQKLWIVLKYANDKGHPDARTKKAVDQVTTDRSSALPVRR